jgi:hypothetical protein
MTKKTLLIALFLLALSGLMLHYRIHNFMVSDRLNPGVFVFDKTRFLSFLFPCMMFFWLLYFLLRGRPWFMVISSMA